VPKDMMQTLQKGSLKAASPNEAPLP